MSSSDHTSATAGREYSFDDFRLIPARQQLLHRGAPVRLGSRALEILAALVERPGELLSKRELIARVWAGSVVEESNLKVHVAALRRALCEDGREARYVATVSGRGYRFVAAVSASDAQPAPDPAGWELMHGLAAPAIGRTETIAALLDIMRQRRLVSIVGPGGIGKSTLARPVAEAFGERSGMETCRVELSPLADPRFLASTVAAALGLTIHSGDGMQALLATLRERRLLLVLDSCEHLIDAVAVLAERLLDGAPELCILATSREPLRAAGEYVYRLTPLGYPAAGAPLSAAQALAFPAVALFVLRAAAGLDGYALSDADAPAVADICRRLEGIPLAIELAATRMDALGAAELAARLGERFELLKRGRRGALERHRTLAASLDWSYGMLPERERGLLRRLAVFCGSFDLDGAAGVCADAATDAAAVVAGVADLADKSLLAVDPGAPGLRYRLLDTTRAYALEKLDLEGETAAARRRHLDYFRGLLEGAATELDTLSDGAWLDKFKGVLPDVRGALGWAFTAADSAVPAVALTVAALPLWTRLSLLDECYQFAGTALAAAPVDAQAEMALRAARAAAALYLNGPLASTEAAWVPVLALADRLQAGEFQLMALWGMAVCRSYAGELQGVLELDARFQSIARMAGGSALPCAMERLIASAHHYAGEQAAARAGLERILARRQVPPDGSRLARMQLDQGSAALAALANVLWVQGYPQRAVQAVRGAMGAARASGHAPSLMYTIANAAFPIMIQTGDQPAAETLLAELAGCLKQHAFTLWDDLWHCLEATVLLQRGEAAAVFQLERAVGRLQQLGYRPRLACHLARLATALAGQGRRGTGLALVEDALALCESGQERWCLAEMLRIKGVLLEQSDAAAAETLYLRALDIAQAQQALSWQLRAATSLARLGTGRGGRGTLRAVLARFSEGFDTADLREARRLLAQPSFG